MALHRSASELDAMLERAVNGGNREKALDLLKEGADPFRKSKYISSRHGVLRNAFSYASLKNDFELLLAFIAEPGTEWGPRYSFSRGTIVSMPLQGRKCIAASVPGTTTLIHMGNCALETIELLLMYGYNPTPDEYFTMSLWWGEKQSLKFTLATKFPVVPTSALDTLLVRVLGVPPTSTSRRNLDLSRLVLRLGANPNDISRWSSDPRPMSCLAQAVHNEDEEMAALLISYGANCDDIVVREKVQESSSSSSSSCNLEYLLDNPPEQLLAPDPANCAKELRKEFMKPFWREVATQSALLTVATMRLTGEAPQPLLMSNLILQYCPLGVTLWPIDPLFMF